MANLTEKEIIESANIHLHATSAEEALSHFTEDVIAVSNDQVFYSRDELEKDIIEYYINLKKVDFAEWQNIKVKAIDNKTGLFSAKFIYSFTDKGDNTTNLEGIWSAVFVKKERIWKICLRHETFSVK